MRGISGGKFHRSLGSGKERGSNVCQRTDETASDIGHCTFKSLQKRHPMLETVAVVLLILWALGMVSAYTLGGFIHVLLVIAVVMILLRLIRGRGV
jgi:hypothetical protein